MSIEAIRSAFMAAGKGVVRLTHAGLAHKDSHQVLTFAGWHADGTNRDCRFEGLNHVSSHQSQRLSALIRHVRFRLERKAFAG
jgi:hypothetical protein